MDGLGEILGRHGRGLVLDAAGWPQAAWWDGGAWTAVRVEADAGVGLFQAIERLGVDPGAADAFVFCSSPGSILGIRTCAIAIRTWNALRPRPVYHYDALELLAAAGRRREVAYVADARRGLWHWRGPQDKAAARISADEVRRRSTELGLRLATPAGFKSWEKLPFDAEIERVDYDLGALLRTGAGRFVACEDPDAALVAAPAYVTWTPAIHRPPAPKA